MPRLGRITPCPVCPWLRRCAPGYLGADSPEHFYRTSVTQEQMMPCHDQIDYDDPDWLTTQLPDVDLCAGNLIYYRNHEKMPRSQRLADAVRAVSRSRHVFTSPEEFFAHHAPGADSGIVSRAQWPYASVRDTRLVLSAEEDSGALSAQADSQRPVIDSKAPDSGPHPLTHGEPGRPAGALQRLAEDAPELSA